MKTLIKINESGARDFTLTADTPEEQTILTVLSEIGSLEHYVMFPKQLGGYGDHAKKVASLSFKPMFRDARMNGLRDWIDRCDPEFLNRFNGAMDSPHEALNAPGAVHEDGSHHYQCEARDHDYNTERRIVNLLDALYREWKQKVERADARAKKAAAKAEKARRGA